MQLAVCVLICMYCVAMVEAFAVRLRGWTPGTMQRQWHLPRVQKYRMCTIDLGLPHTVGAAEIASIVDAVLSNSMLPRLSPAASLVSTGPPLGDSQNKYDHTRWNQLLESCLQHKLGKRVMELVLKMQECSIPLVSGVGLKVLNYLSDTWDYDGCRNVLQWMKRTGTPVTGYHYLALLRCSGNYERAQRVLLQMARANQKVHVATYSVAVKACERTGDILGALRLMDQMRAAGVIPNEVTYCCAISVAAKAGRPDIAVNLLREFEAIARAGSTGTSLLSIDTNNPGTASYLTRSSGGSVNQYCYGSTISACAKAGWWGWVVTLLGEIVQSGARIEDTVFRAVLVALRDRANAPHVEIDRVALLSTLLSKWTQHLAFTTDHVYGTAMEVYQQHHRSDLVLDTYHERVSRLPEAPLSTATLRCVMRACVDSGSAQLAGAVVQRAKRDGVLTSAVALAAVTVFERAQGYAAAVKLMVEVLLPAREESKENGSESNGAGAATVQQSKVQLPRPMVMRVVQGALREVVQQLGIPVEAETADMAGAQSEESYAAAARMALEALTAAETSGDAGLVEYARHIARLGALCGRRMPRVPSESQE